MEGMTGYVMPLEPPAVGWDIHCHTAFSDGTETPATLAEQSKALGLKGVAISDHDTTAGWPEAEAAAHRVGLPLLRGTEITATDENVSVHMLGYQYDPTNQHITDLFANTRAARLQRTQRMVELLSRDYPITWQSVLAQVKEGSKTTIGRPHIADALVSAGVYRTRSEAFADAVSASSKYYIPTPSPTSHEVVAAVKSGELSLNAAAVVATLPVEEQKSAAAGGAQELKQAAKRVRDSKKKPKADAAATEADGTAGPESTAAPDAAKLQQRVAELEAENERLRQQVKALQDLLAEQG